MKPYYYDAPVETLDRQALLQHQSEKLVWQVKRCYENVECFRKRMDEMGLKPEDIKGVKACYSFFIIISPPCPTSFF